MFLIIKGRFFEKLTKIIFEIVHSKIFGYTVVLWHQIWDTLYSSKKFMYHFKNVNNSRTVQNKYDIGIEIRKKELFRDVIIYRVCRVSFTLELQITETLIILYYIIIWLCTYFIQNIYLYPDSKTYRLYITNSISVWCLKYPITNRGKPYNFGQHGKVHTRFDKATMFSFIPSYKRAQ